MRGKNRTIRDLQEAIDITPLFQIYQEIDSRRRKEITPRELEEIIATVNNRLLVIDDDLRMLQALKAELGMRDFKSYQAGLLLMTLNNIIRRKEDLFKVLLAPVEDPPVKELITGVEQTNK